MSGKRILTIFGTRPEAIKLFPLLHALAGDGRCESRTCVTGQHREMLDQVLAIAQVKPNHDLSLMRPGQSLDELTAALLAGLGPVMDDERPDWSSCKAIRRRPWSPRCAPITARFRFAMSKRACAVAISIIHGLKR